MPRLVNKGGRPPVEIDLKIVERMAQSNCTDTDIATALGVSRSSVKRIKKNKHYRAAIERGRISTRMLIRAKLLEQINLGNMTAIIWGDKTINGVTEFGGTPGDSLAEVLVTVKRPERKTE